VRRTYYPISPGSIRVPVPDATQQKDYSCGAVCLQSVAKYYGVGPDDEWEFIRDMRFDHRVGSHPDQVIRAAKKYGLRWKEYFPGTVAAVKSEVRRGHPVLLMIQAWGDRPGTEYIKDWKDGHWVIAIGYDPKVIFFEDPSLAAVRGYLHNRELLARWRDTARHGRQMPRYAVALWRPRARRSFYTARAERIA
jgi:predicted double-glycine peptidase